MAKNVQVCWTRPEIVIVRFEALGLPPRWDSGGRRFKSDRPDQNSICCRQTFSERMDRFLDDNPYCEARPVSYANNPDTIARNKQARVSVGCLSES